MAFAGGVSPAAGPNLADPVQVLPARRLDPALP
jgi:hypothetical protein